MVAAPAAAAVAAAAAATEVRRRALLGGLLAAASCGPPPPSASLPSGFVSGAGDPTRAAIIECAYVFNNPASVAGRPEQAARAVAAFEYLAVELPYGPRWPQFGGIVAPQLASGRAELRAAFGIAPNTPPQPVINALFSAANALIAGDPQAAAAVLPPAIFTLGGQATLARLAALPYLPQTATAAAAAERQMRAIDMDQFRPRRLR